ncbi:uncharacterized protein LOC115623130 [Scaptodrosophila lebanonensis]|uniref:Uncharacterized protein LOC115623130 n=1 Tax=Drosophila lebanonensis TaxID=7225 RepID=A0A6J2TAY7_DROLE|nr:uncharacterized protein LOC115623130 [Scaptodrosophila lebanonensis]
MYQNLYKSLCVFSAIMGLCIKSVDSHETVDCGPCQELNDWCKVGPNTPYGYACESHVENDHGIVKNDKGGVADKLLAQCVPEEVKVVNINTTCCTWSPKIGCHMIKSRKTVYPYDKWVDICWQCAETCPCTNEDPRNSLAHMNNALIGGLLSIVSVLHIWHTCWQSV